MFAHTNTPCLASVNPIIVSAGVEVKIFYVSVLMS